MNLEETSNLNLTIFHHLLNFECAKDQPNKKIDRK